jgi:hypothetical protein
MRADFRELAGGSSPRHGASVWRVPQPTDPAHDLKTSLAELMQDLQRARAANFSPRSFAPPAHHTERVAAEVFWFKQQRKARTVPFKLSERVASILGVEPSLAVALRGNRRRLLMRRAAGVSTVAQKSLLFCSPGTRLGFGFPASAAVLSTQASQARHPSMSKLAPEKGANLLNRISPLR